jgi:hypothetical protein
MTTDEAVWTTYLDGLDELIAWTESRLVDEPPADIQDSPDAPADPAPPTVPPPRSLRQRSEDARRRLVDTTYRAELCRTALAKALATMPKHQQRVASTYGTTGSRLDILG